ncbi:MAG: hypothetical protein N4A71_03185 [Carboxylicivirga sp.]|jgi:hypothetical protein|nr:hypothetical protein [Carboxylicivirga sp.]MCT4646464.1 hypothetical protein [Carboxylicivirga sp.]
MGHKEDYASRKDEAMALPKEDVLNPYMPTSIYCQEAEDLVVWATEDQAKLAAAGLPENYLVDIPVWVGALHQAQSLWMREKQTQKMAEQEWAEKSPEAADFRDQLIHAFRFIFRKEERILKLVSEIAEGSSDADLVSDLNDLSVLGLAHLDKLPIAALGEEDMNRAAQLSDELSNLRAKANGVKDKSNEYSDMRNRMYTKLKELVDEVRVVGKFVFWRDAKRVKGYASAYNRRRNKAQKQSVESSEE